MLVANLSCQSSTIMLQSLSGDIMSFCTSKKSCLFANVHPSFFFCLFSRQHQPITHRQQHNNQLPHCCCFQLTMPSCMWQLGYMCRCRDGDQSGGQRCVAASSRAEWKKHIDSTTSTQRERAMSFPPEKSLAGTVFNLSTTANEATTAQRRRIMRQAGLTDADILKRGLLETHHKITRNKPSSKLTFVKPLMICGCHISVDDTTTEGLRKGSSIKLTLEANAHKPAALAADTPLRVSPKRRAATTPIAQRALQEEEESAKSNQRLKGVVEEQERTLKRARSDQLGKAQEYYLLKGQLSQVQGHAHDKISQTEQQAQLLHKLLLDQQHKVLVLETKLKFEEQLKEPFEEYAKRLHKLMRAVDELQGELTPSTIIRVCQDTGCQDEVTRMQALAAFAPNFKRRSLEFSPRSNSSVGSQITQSVAAAWAVGVVAGRRQSETRKRLVDMPTDTLSRIGLAPSQRTEQRRRSKLIENYPRLLDGWLRKQLATGSFLVHWDDDLTRFWRLMTYTHREEKWRTHKLTVSAINSSPGTMPRVHPSIPHQDPNIISVERIMDEIDETLPFTKSHFERATDGGYNRAPEHECWNTESLRERTGSVNYASATAQDINLKCANAKLLEVLDQPFHSHGDMLRALMVVFKTDVLREMLSADFILLSVGDYPKQALQRTLLFQTNRHPASTGNHFGMLCRAADPKTFDSIAQKEGHDTVEETEVFLGNMAQNIVQVSGPLHYKLNQCKDIVEAWFQPLFNRLNVLYEGTELPKSPHMRSIAIMCDAVFIAWWHIRDSALPLLQPFKHRFDVAALLWLLENRLPMAVLSYDVVFKKNMAGPTLEFLRDSGHPMYEYFSSNQRLVDECFGEGGVNAKLRNIMEGQKHLETEQLIRMSYDLFARNMDTTSNNLQRNFTKEWSKKRSYTTRDLSQRANVAAHLLADMILSLVSAEGDDLPRRASTTKAQDFWVCKALFNRNTQTPFKFQSTKHGSAGYALFPQVNNKANFRAPDSPGDGGCCGMVDAAPFNAQHVTTRAHCPKKSVVVLPCAHAYCSDCQQREEYRTKGGKFHCPHCAAESRKNLTEKANLYKHTLSTQVITVESLEKHEQAKNDDNSDDDSGTDAKGMLKDIPDMETTKKRLHDALGPAE
eukprot:m.437681 g.437681  ORF g.437681 m.437681 type:complete len:1133 (-) comp20273_c1_seq28:783-4181(-)